MDEPLGTTDEMPFGKYFGVLVGTVIEEDRGYIRWMLDKTDYRLDETALAYYENL